MEKNVKILLIEDFEDDALLIKRELERSGFFLECERIDTPEGLKKMLAERKWDIILSDYNMPRFSAMEALVSVRKKDEDLPFIVVSGNIGEEMAAAAMKAGANDYIFKDNLKRLPLVVEREIKEAIIRRERKVAQKKLDEYHEHLEKLVERRTLELQESNDKLKRDILAREKAEKALKRSREIYFLAQKAAKMGSWDWDVSNGKVEWSDEIEPIFGLKKGEFKGTYEDFLAHVYFADRKFVMDAVDDSLERGNRYDIEHRIIWQDGSVRWVSEKGSVIRDKNGKAVRMFGMVQDITKRKESERALELSEKRFRSLFDNNNDAIIVSDLKTERCASCNKMAGKLTGFSKQELLAKRFQGIFAPDCAEEVFSRLKQLKQGERFKSVVRILTKNKGEIFTELNSTLIKIGNKQHLLSIFHDMKNLRALEEEREKARKYLDMAGSIIVALDKKGKVSMINKRGCQILGYSRKEIIGKDWFDNFLPVKTKNKVKNFFNSLIAGNGEKSEKEFSYFENRIISKKGEERLIAWHNVFIKDEKGRIVGSLSSGEDITERRGNEEKLKESERKYKIISESSPDCIKLFNVQGKLLFLNRTGLKLLGLKSMDEVENFDYVSCIEPKYRSLFVRAFKKAANGKISFLELKRLLPDGLSKDISEIIVPVRDGGKISKIFIVSRDISEIKQARESLEKQAQELRKFQLAVENATDGIIITDNFGKILYSNKASERITGFSKKEMIGALAGGKKLWGGLMDEKFYKNLWRTIKLEKKVFFGEIKNRKKNGEIYDAEIHIAPILDKKGNVNFFVSIERDITEAKEMDSTKSELISRASHQLRTPLSSINLNLELLLRGIAGDFSNEQKEYLEELQETGQKMSELISDFMNISKIELGTFGINHELTDVVGVAESVIKMLQPKIRQARLRIIRKYDKKLGLVDLDPNIAKIVLQNILANAVEYTPSRGKVTISINKEKGNNFSIKVSDTGYGIPEKQQDKIFTKMFRAENVKRYKPNGSGLGLYMARAVVKKSCGKIWFESKENKGTDFYVSLPIRRGKK